MREFNPDHHEDIRLSDYVGKRVVVETERGQRKGTARYTKVGGDQEFLVVDIDGDSMGTSVRPEHIVGLA